ncbi:MAG TPA: hypothetical protein DCM10_09305 [Xanthomarina gelatinilytica]|nr:hypothetical protein [Phycisphaerae bacterium]HAI18190.1 hypothetical protein [Xanthomarina gelatinilytica]|tara:strand:- start:617 stop:1270 length:654 start_codon:yes stop_codon:yes gene_type:complete
MNPIEKLITLTASVFNIDDIYSKSRVTKYVYARAVVFYLLRKNHYMTFKDIADIFNKHHATVLHSIKEMPYMLKFDKNFEAKFNKIKLLWLDNVENLDFSVENNVKNLQERNNLLNLLIKEYQSHTTILKNKILFMASKEDCPYTILDVDKIYNYSTWSTKRKVDALLHIDCIMYCNLGIDSTITERKEVKQKSKLIYRTIKKLDESAGKQFLLAMD